MRTVLRGPLKVAIDLLKILAEEGRFSWLAVVLHHSAPTKKSLSLRRVALGISQPADLPARDITRLKALSLIEEHGAGLGLTPVGRERYLALPNSGAIYESETPDEFISKMAEFMSKARG
jgi:hypothetical protein